MGDPQNIWLWPAALYLFLGGVSSGLYLVAGTACILRRRRFARVYRAALLISSMMLAAGLLFLLAELVKPTQAFLVWQSFSNTSSWMAWGAWAAVICTVLFCLSGIFECPGPSGWLREILAGVPYLREDLRTGFVALGMLGAAFITVYTGFLLARASGVPFWNSPLLPPLFSVSAINAGLSALMALGILLRRMKQVAKPTRRTLTGIALGLTVLEGALLALFLFSMSKGGGFNYEAQRMAAANSAYEILAGRFSWSFWILVPVLGLMAPSIVFSICAFGWVKVPNGVLLACTLFSILSDAALRFLILYAGIYPDWFASLLSAL